MSKSHANKSFQNSFRILPTQIEFENIMSHTYLADSGVLIVQMTQRGRY